MTDINLHHDIQNFKINRSAAAEWHRRCYGVMVLQSQVVHGMAKPGKYFWNLPFQMAWRALVYISPAMMYNFGTFIEAQS